MLIRKATLEDCAELTKIRIDFRRESETGNLTFSEDKFYQNTLAYFARGMTDGSFAAFIAIEDNEIVATSGVCFYTVPPTYQNPSGLVAYVMNMYTKPEYRGRGLATRLLGEIVGEAKSRGCTKVTLNASQMGKPVYTRFGFTEVQNAMVFYISQDSFL